MAALKTTVNTQAKELSQQINEQHRELTDKIQRVQEKLQDKMEFEREKTDQKVEHLRSGINDTLQDMKGTLSRRASRLESIENKIEHNKELQSMKNKEFERSDVLLSDSFRKMSEKIGKVTVIHDKKKT